MQASSSWQPSWLSLIPLVRLQHVSDFFVTSANAALSKSDEPEKVRSCLGPQTANWLPENLLQHMLASCKHRIQDCKPQIALFANTE